MSLSTLRRRFVPVTLAVAMALAVGQGRAAATPDWHSGLELNGRHASIVAAADGSYRLTYDGGERQVAPQAWRADTASALFNGLFAMAQDDAKLDSVEAIHDHSFDNGQPIACHCFATGAKWPFVWTRDLSLSLDLGLWRLDPDRATQSLAFKESPSRGDVPRGEYVMQDTGSGGSWPISTDRVVWFMGARHLLDNQAFAGTVNKALVDTLAQDRLYVFDPALGLYRGETSFLDWRDQTYPAWTTYDVSFIGQSFALSTNVLHYQALRMAAAHASGGDAATFNAQADALKRAINTHFWRADRGLYMSYIGGDVQPMPFDTYDLLGLSLAITSNVADAAQARSILAHYPTWATGTPVIWPERADEAIYHNRAIWPFVSAYALRAARAVNSPAHIEHEVRSIIRGAALSGSNMENFELLSQSIHVEDGAHTGPVINSPRQLWSVAAFVGMVVEGVFGLDSDNRIEPKLPVALVPMLFGDRQAISLTMGSRSIVLKRPASLAGNLLVEASRSAAGDTTTITLKAETVSDIPLRRDAPLYAPTEPVAPQVKVTGNGYSVSAVGGALYLNGMRQPGNGKSLLLSRKSDIQCISATATDAGGIESMPTREQCVGDIASLAGAGPWQWRAPRTGTYDLATWYANDHGNYETGVTAAVYLLDITCGKQASQQGVLVMPHGTHVQRSTLAQFEARAGDTCTISPRKGFNMSNLARFGRYTAGQGGKDGPLNEADVQKLEIRSITTH